MAVSVPPVVKRRSQLPAFGLGIQLRRNHYKAVSELREYPDRLPQRQARAEQSDEPYVQGGDAASEIVGEAQARAAHAGRKQFGQERPHA